MVSKTVFFNLSLSNDYRRGSFSKIANSWIKNKIDAASDFGLFEYGL